MKVIKEDFEIEALSDGIDHSNYEDTLEKELIEEFRDYVNGSEYTDIDEALNDFLDGNFIYYSDTYGLLEEYPDEIYEAAANSINEYGGKLPDDIHRFILYGVDWVCYNEIYSELEDVLRENSDDIDIELDDEEDADNEESEGND